MMLFADNWVLINKTKYESHRAIYILPKVSRKCNLKVFMQKEKLWISKVNIVFERKSC